MDALQCLIASQVRAEVLAAVFLAEPREWRPSELGRAAGMASQNVGRELDWLVDAGVLHVRLLDGRRTYAVATDNPLARELGQLVRQARGPVPAMRQALERLTLPVIAWLVRLAPPGEGGQVSDLVVLTSAPRSVIQLQLAKVVGRETRTCVMSVAEWMARLQKGELVARRARRARKLWVVGSWTELVRVESRHLEMRRSMEAARADWREELSDEWDEGFDPFDPKERAG